MRTGFTSFVLLALLVGCAEPPPTVDRRARLLTMAVAEAGQVPDAQARLKRQLNLADQQLDDDAVAAGRQTLTAAAATLREAKAGEVPPRIRIAGWVSISELSRRAKDAQAANAACDRAVAALRSQDRATDRAEYVVGVAREVSELRGEPAGAALLVEAVAWARQFEQTYDRRLALAAIADAIFDCEDYDAGLAAVRTDPDAAWRSDTLAALSRRRQMDWIMNVGNGSVPGSVVADSVLTRPGRPHFGQPVDYQSVFGSGSR